MSIYDGKLKLEASCASGIEAVLKRELKTLGFEPSGAVYGRVPFEGNFFDVARANVFLRTAEKVRIIVAEFVAETFDELYEGIYRIKWNDVVTYDAKIVVNAKSFNSKLFALSSIQSVSQKAILEGMKRDFRLDRISSSGSEYSFEVYIIDNVVRVKLDTSGAALHKRGYRTYLGDAPIKETLASAMIELSVWKWDRALIDPFCGSGTIAVEAAMIGLNIASGMNRSFAFENFKNAPSVRETVQSEAEESIARERKLNICGFDIDPNAIKLALKHAAAAGVKDNVHFQVRDMRDVSSRFSHGVIICNPPYGERLMDATRLKDLYRDFGKMCRSLNEWCVYCITSFKGFEKYFGRKADRVRKLYNSELECGFYQYLASPPKRVAKDDNVTE